VSRLLSLLLVLAYVTGAGVVAGTLSALKILAAMLVPLACVWFPEALGEYTGDTFSRAIIRPSPPSFVWFLGWIVLLLPLIVGSIFWLQGVPLDGLLD
jgi:hypothetical protein